MSIENAFRQAMSQYAGAVTAITTLENDTPYGLIATAVCSLSMDPPSIIVCVNRAASAHDVILRQGRFAINLLHPSQSQVVDNFTRRKGDARFALDNWDLDGGAPLLDQAIAGIRCRLAQQYDGFSHSILVGIVEEVRLRDVDEEGCLLWQGKGLHRSIPIIASHPTV